MPVQFGVQGDALRTAGQQQSKKTNSPNCEEYPPNTSQQCEQNAFGQQLTEDPQPSCTHAQTQRDFVLARSGARQQQIGDIGARDRQNQSDERHQYVQRLGKLPPQGVQPGRPFLESQRRKIRPLAVIRGGGRHPLLKSGRQRGLGLRETDSGAQSSHDLNPVVVLVEVIIGSKPELIGSAKQNVGVHRKIDVGSRRGIDAEEFRRRDTNHGER